MTTMADERANSLAALINDDLGGSLDLSEVQSIDDTLKNDWGIDFIQFDSMDELLHSLPASRAVEVFLERHDEVAEAMLAGDDYQQRIAEGRLYDCLGNAELLGPVTSARRHLILDALCLFIAHYRYLGLDGPILDVGCHAGMTSQILARHLSRPVVGIDPSSPAIELGRSRINNSDITLIAEGIPWKTDRRFNAAFVLDAMPEDRGVRTSFIRGVSELLTDGAYCLIVSMHWSGAPYSKTKRTLESAQLGFCVSDVIGGYGGVPLEFDAEVGVALVKGSKREYTENAIEISDRNWSRFQDYANTPGTASRHKTQAFERATLKSSRGAVAV